MLSYPRMLLYCFFNKKPDPRYSYWRGDVLPRRGVECDVDLPSNHRIIYKTVLDWDYY